MPTAPDVLAERFHPAIAQWFSERLGQPTAIQEAAWPRIAEGRHVLVSAPTGSGKTLTAFLWAINQLLNETWSAGTVRVVYVSPLKALNNDIRRNVLKPLQELSDYCWQHGTPMPKIQVMTRSGDTPSKERRKMLTKPPEILVTTPESLNILLTAKSSRDILCDVKTVIIDEVHAIINDKRGVYCFSAIERLAWLSGEFQRVALSATVSPMQHVAEVLGGYQLHNDGAYSPRVVEIIDADIDKQMDVRVEQPDEEPDYSSDDKDAVWYPLIRRYISHINQNRSTLLFSGTRVQAEKVTRLINEEAEQELAYAHHGSLAREIRYDVEQAFKGGLLKAMVATNSLEMGIDIGDLDEVLLISTPLQVNSAIQRIGRAGHSVGACSVGRFMPVHDKDLLTAAVMAPMVQERDIEGVQAVGAALDVLAQLIICVCNEGAWHPDDLYKHVKCIWSYRDLRRQSFDLVIAMLLGRYADTRIKELKHRLELDPITDCLSTKRGVAMLFYSSGGVIPDRGYFKIKMEGSGAVIGELDEEFVWEQDVGTPFVIGTQTWRIKEINDNDVLVEPYQGNMAKIPFWRGESNSRSFRFGTALADFLEQADQRLDDPQWQDALISQHYLDLKSQAKLIDYLQRQKRYTGHLPHRHLIVVEHCGEKREHTEAEHVIIHAPFGVRVLRPWALALSGAVADRFDLKLETMVNDDCILLHLPPELSVAEVMQLVGPEEVEFYLRSQLERTPYFGARFRENAARALLLPRQQINKRMPLWLNRLRAKKLYERVARFRDFPIVAETWRECLQDHFDLEHLGQILSECKAGVIQMHVVQTAKASPFADSLIYRNINQYMYEDDRPYADAASQLSTDVLQHVLHNEQVALPRDLINSFTQTQRRCLPDTAPESSEDLLSYLEDYGFLAWPLWEQLKSAIADNTESECDVQEVAEIAARVTIPGIKQPYLILAHHAQRLARLLAQPLDTWQLAAVAGRALPETWQQLGRVSSATSDEAPDWSALLLEIAQISGPQARSNFVQLWGLDPIIVDPIIDTLISEHHFSEIISADDGEVFIGLSDHYERLLRIHQQFKRRQQQVQPLSVLFPLLARLQGLQRIGCRDDEGDILTQAQTDLRACFERLFAFPAPAAAWERDILPARIAHYQTQFLDVLMQETELLWFGTAKQQVAFSLRDQLPVFHRPPYDRSALEQLFPNAQLVDFHSLQERSGKNSAALTETLWQHAWDGLISSDSFAAVRQGIQHKFTASVIDKEKSQGRRWQRAAWTSSRPFQQLWHALPKIPQLAARDAMDLAKERVRQLLARYGIVFRELLKREQPHMQWRSLLPALRVMSLSGEILSGYFLDGVCGFQFASQEALQLIEEQAAWDEIYWCNGLDPASLCGVDVDDLKQILPHRHANTYLCFHGQQLVLIAKRLGKDCQFLVPAGDRYLADYCGLFQDLLARRVDPASKIVIERINDEPVLTSPYRSALEQCGFESTGKDLVLRKRY